MPETVYHNVAKTTRGTFVKEALSRYSYVVTFLDDQGRGCCYGWVDSQASANMQRERARRAGLTDPFIELVTSCTKLTDPKPKHAAGITYFNR